MAWVLSVLSVNTTLITQPRQSHHSNGECKLLFQNLFIKLAGCSKCLDTRFTVRRLIRGFSALAVYSGRRTDHCEHSTRCTCAYLSRSCGLFLVQTTDVQKAKARRDYREFVWRNCRIACLNCESILQNVLCCLQTLLSVLCFLLWEILSEQACCFQNRTNFSCS